MTGAIPALSHRLRPRLAAICLGISLSVSLGALAPALARARAPYVLLDPKGFDAPSRDYDSGALAGECHSKPPADSGAATGDETAFAGKFHGPDYAFGRV